MVKDPVQGRQTDEFGIDILGNIKRHGTAAGRIAIVASLVVAVVFGAFVVWFQPVRQASVLEFRPTFDGIEQGEYPNGLPFASSDVSAAPILDMVYDGNQLTEYCSREAFRGGFFVEQRSDQSAFLEAEYQGRLAEERITPVERQRLQAE